MSPGYLVLAAEQRVLGVTFDSGLDAVQRAIGCQSIEHGTTFCTEDQLIINGDETDQMPEHWFRVVGVPFPFYGNALLVGINPLDGETAEQPAMSIDELRRLISFGTRSNKCERPK
jgi:hypothetical protein